MGWEAQLTLAGGCAPRCFACQQRSKYKYRAGGMLVWLWVLVGGFGPICSGGETAFSRVPASLIIAWRSPIPRLTFLIVIRTLYRYPVLYVFIVYILTSHSIPESYVFWDNCLQCGRLFNTPAGTAAAVAPALRLVLRRSVVGRSDWPCTWNFQEPTERLTDRLYKARWFVCRDRGVVVSAP